MGDTSLEQTVVEFLRRLDDTRRAQLEMEFDLRVVDGADAPTLEVDSDLDLGELEGASVQIRLPVSAEASGWVADAKWGSDGELILSSVRRTGSEGGSLEHSRSEYRVAVPPSSVAALTRLKNGETVSVEPIDISRGGIGLNAEDDVALEAGERVEVDLNIVGEFAGTLTGQVAFARTSDSSDQVRIGVKFEELDPSVAESLRQALNNILLGTTQKIT